MQSTIGIKQPWLGLAATTLAVCISLAICAYFEPATLGGWVALLIMCGIPTQMTIGMVWQNQYPPFLGKLTQPAKGLAILAIMAVAGVAVTMATMRVVGGGTPEPTPFVIMYTIQTVVFSIWTIIVFQCWPAKVLFKHPAAMGLANLALTYLVAWVVFRLSFDFGGMAGAPFYNAAIDPHGAFPAWNALAFTVTSAVTVMLLVGFDFWPLTVLAARLPWLGKQPIFGLATGALVLAISALSWQVFVVWLGLDVVAYLVRVPVSVGFGVFIMLIMFQTAPFQSLRQPAKGVAVFSLVVVLAIVMRRLYEMAALGLVGPMASGAPGYDLELWLATAMLSVTFPILVAYGDGFGFWPLSIVKAKSQQE